VGPVPRWVVAVAGVAVLVVAADVAIFVAARGPSAKASTPNGAVAVIDPKSGRVVSRVEVGRNPTAITAGYGGIWVLNRSEGTVAHIDARSAKLVSTLEPDATANTLSLGAGGVWFAGPPRGVSAPLQDAKLERINPATGAVDRRFDTSTGATVVAVGGGSLWSTGYLGRHIRGSAGSDARTGRMHHVDIPIYGDLVTADNGAVYYVGTLGKRVARLSARTGRLTSSMTLATDESLAAGVVPPDPTGVVIGGDSIWISESDGTVLRIDRALKGITATIPACGNALAVAYGESAVWVACGDGTVVRVDPATDEPAGIVPVGRLPQGIAAGEGAVWVTLG
jgi:streptogramin lyase